MDLTLAQSLQGLQEPAIPPLPGPPLWERALLEQPAYLAGALILAAIVAFVLFNQRGKLRHGLGAASGLGLLAAAVLALGAAVQTEREQMAAATKSLVEITATGDASALGAMLAPDAQLFSAFQVPEFAVPSSGLDRDAILSAVRKATGDHPMEARVDAVQAESLGPGTGRTQVRVRVIFRENGVPLGSWWRLSWRKSAEGNWRVTSIQPLYIAGATLAR